MDWQEYGKIEYILSRSVSTLRNAGCFFFGLAHKFFGLVDENFGLLHKFFGLDVSREALFPDFNCLKQLFFFGIIHLGYLRHQGVF